MKHRRISLALILSVCLLAAGTLLAQSDLGRISGFIKDPSGATIPNAKVTVQNKSGVTRQTTTNESGYYTITNVPPGLYTVVAEAPGFQRYQSADNKLDSSSNLVVDATLEEIAVAAGAAGRIDDVWTVLGHWSFSDFVHHAPLPALI